jgi:hypothetical protein
MDTSISGDALISIKFGQSLFCFTASAIVPAGFFLTSRLRDGQSFARDHWQFFIEHQHSLLKVILIQHEKQSIYSYIRISEFDGCWTRGIWPFVVFVATSEKTNKKPKEK